MLEPDAGHGPHGTTPKPRPLRMRER
jgi:hypothetical protein